MSIPSACQMCAYSSSRSTATTGRLECSKRHRIPQFRERARTQLGYPTPKCCNPSPRYPQAYYVDRWKTSRILDITHTLICQNDSRRWMHLREPLTILLESCFFVFVLRRVFWKWGRSPLRIAATADDGLGWLLSTSGGSAKLLSRTNPLSKSDCCGIWKTPGVPRLWRATTSRRSSTISKVINAPTPIFWSRQNFVHPSPTLTAEIPVVSAENRRKVTAHSFFMLIEVTNAHSSLAGHHVSAVKVAGISCIIPPTRRVLEFTLVHTLHPHKRHGGQHMVHTLCGRGDPADAAQLCPMRMMQADAPGGHTLCLLGMIDQQEIGLLGQNSKRSPRPTRAKPPSPSMDPPWPALIANFWF